MTKKEKKEAEQKAIEHLRSFIKPGDTIYAHINSVSSSGMSRHMDLYVLGINDGSYKPGKPFIQRITWDVAKALGWTYDRKAEDLRVSGCGMDMCFHTVYSLAWALFKEGWECVGEGCKSNDHSNGDRDFTVGKKHSDPGYALNKENI